MWSTLQKKQTIIHILYIKLIFPCQKASIIQDYALSNESQSKLDNLYMVSIQRASTTDGKGPCWGNHDMKFLVAGNNQNPIKPAQSIINHHKNPTKFFLLLLRIPENRLPEILERGKDDPQQSRGDKKSVCFLYLGWLGRVKVVLESIVTLCGKKSFSTLATVRLVCIQFSCFDPMNYCRYCFCQSLFHWVHNISQVFLSIWDGAQNIADFSLTRKKDRVVLLVDTH